MEASESQGTILGEKCDLRDFVLSSVRGEFQSMFNNWKASDCLELSH